MPRLTFPFDLNGMFVDVLVSPGGERLNKLLARGKPLPRPIWARGLIDTGTNISGVSRAILRQLGVRKAAATSTQGISGRYKTNDYVVSLTITDKATPGVVYSPPDVTVIHLTQPDIDVLIGLDLLMDCRLLIDGPAKQFTLDF